MERKVFICYNNEDKEYVENLTNLLKRMNIPYFIDRRDVEWGDPIPEKIKNEISTCTDFIVILSEASLKSDWVRYEIGQASTNNLRILPLLLNENLAVPDYLQGIQYKTTLEDVEYYFRQTKAADSYYSKQLHYNPEKESTLPKLLLIDDKEYILKELGEDLQNEGFSVFTTSSRIEAENIWRMHKDIKVALIDLHMPDDLDPGADPQKTGFRIIKEFKKIAEADNRLFAISALSAYHSHENLEEAIIAGCDGFISKSWEPKEIVENVKNLLQKIDTTKAFYALQKSLEMRTPYTCGHCERVVEFCRKIIPFIKSVDGHNFDLNYCLTAASIHDIGKISLPDIILKGTKSPLTESERQIIQKHVEVNSIFKEMGQGINKIAEIIRYHHLYYKNPGDEVIMDYPKKDKDGNPAPREEKIPKEARVLKVADVVDAVLSDRIYSYGEKIECLISILEKGKDKEFDPEVVNAFIEFVQYDQNNKGEEIEKILKTGTLTITHSLQIYYNIRSLTLGIFEKIIESLSEIYLEDGRAIDRVILETGPTRERINTGKDLLFFSATGTKKDIYSLFELLKGFMAERNKYLKRINTLGVADLDIHGFFVQKSTPVLLIYLDKIKNKELARYPKL